MAHFAQLDENNTVIQVIVVHNNELMMDGQENETKGIFHTQQMVKDTIGMKKRPAGCSVRYDNLRQQW